MGFDSRPRSKCLAIWGQVPSEAKGTTTLTMDSHASIAH